MKSARVAPLFLFLLLLSCAPGLDPVLERAQLSCESGSECPDGKVCVRELKRCLQRENPCIEPDGDGFRTVEAGRRCTAEGGGAGVCLRASCEPSRCGDGIVDRALTAPEECDDGERNSDLLPDACRQDCRLARCGDGVRDSAEECDDGNSVDQDGCLRGCIPNRCGDGIVDPAAEECDDGDEDDTDECTVLCEAARCGDGFVQEGVEHCEDGNHNPNDGCDACRSTRWNVRLRVGWGEGAGTATAVSLDSPTGIDLDAHGNLFVADYDHHRILKFEPETNRVTTIAGTGEQGLSVDGEPAPRARIGRPTDVAVDRLGNVYFAELVNYCVRRIDGTSGTIETVAGIPGATPPDLDDDGYPESQGDGGPATLALIGAVDALAVDARGNIFLTQRTENLVRWVDVDTGNLHRFAGTGTRGNGGDGGPADEASLTEPTGLAVDGEGNLFIASGAVVRRVDAKTWRISTVSTLPGEAAGLDMSADGTLAVALPYDSAVLGVASTGAGFTLAGSGAEGFAGDGGPALQASFYGPMSVAWGPDGSLYVADTFNHRVRRVRATGSRPIDTVAGNGSPSNGSCVRNDCVRLEDSSNLAVAPGGRILVADTNTSVVHWVDPAQDTHGVFAGRSSHSGYQGDGGPAAEAMIYWPRGLAFDAQGNLFLADRGNRRIRRVDPAGTITTYAGSDPEGDSTAPVAASQLQMRSPNGLAIDSQGNLFISDTLNRRIRRVDAQTRLATVVASDDGAGLLPGPEGLAFDLQGRLLVADALRHAVLLVGQDGTLQPVAGTGMAGFGGDGGDPLAARLNGPTELAVARDGAILVADTGNRRVRRISPDRSRIETVAGGGTRGDGDGGPAASARLTWPSGLAFDAEGALLISDHSLETVGKGRVRRVDPSTGIITTVLGPVMPPGDGPLATSRLGTPGALARLERSGGGDLLLVADGATGRVRGVDLEAGLVSTLAGYPLGFEEDRAPAGWSRQLFDPQGIAADPAAGMLYVSEAEGHTIRRIDVRTQPWTIATFYGQPLSPGADSGLLYGPRGLALDVARHTLYVAEAENHVVRAIDLANPATSRVVAGAAGVRGYLDAADARDGLLFGPEALALGGDGSLYVADTGNHRVRRIALPTGAQEDPAPLETVTGLGLPWCGEGRPAANHAIDSPRGLAVDAHGNLFIAGSGTAWVIGAGDDGRATGADELQIIYGRLPRVGMPESATLCLSGMLLGEGEAGAESRLYLLDACQGYLLELDRTRL